MFKCFQRFQKGDLRPPILIHELKTINKIVNTDDFIKINTQ